jgi:hypothetical protein
VGVPDLATALFIHAENNTALFAAMNLWKSSLPVKSTVILGRKTCEEAWEGESRGKACQGVSMKPPPLNAVLPGIVTPCTYI